MTEAAPQSIESLITLDEAQKVVTQQGRPIVTYRNPLMVIVGSIFLTCTVLLVMLIFSLRGATTGLGSILPFLDNQQTQNLQLPPQ